MQKRKRFLDIGLIVVIIAMSVFVFFRIDRIIGFFRVSSLSSSDAQEDEEPLPEINPTATEYPEKQSDSSPTAPNFQLYNLNSEMVSLAEFKGSAVMVNFWATWCPPCRAELPLIQEHADQYPDQLVVLAVNAGEEKSNVKHFVETFDYEMVFLLDPDNYAANLYQIRGLPTTIFVDEEGVWQATHIGELNEPLLSNYLRKIGVIE